MTINGKTLEQVLKEISAPADFNKSTLLDRWNFFEIGDYENRLNSVVGQSHYISRFSEPQIITLPTGQVIFVQNCEISFIADDDSVVYRASGTGSFEIKKAETGDKFISLNNAGYFCQVAAFKSACRDLQMFAIHEKSGEQKTNKKTDKPRSGVSVQKESVNETLCTSGPMELVRNDKDNKPVYKLQAHICVGTQMREVPSTILFYPNQYKGFEKQINNLYVVCSGKSTKVRLVLSKANTEDTFIFKGFWG